MLSNVKIMKLEMLPEKSSFNQMMPDAGENAALMIEEMLQCGIRAAKSGQRLDAYHILTQVTDADPHNESAWLWLASISEYPEELIVFLKRVLAINPTNQRALEWARATHSLLAKTFVRRGIDSAAREDGRDFARQCFLQAITYDEQNEMAWLWLVSLADSSEEKRRGLEKVLEINPANDAARSSLAALSAKQSPAEADTEILPGENSGAANESAADLEILAMPEIISDGRFEEADYELEMPDIFEESNAPTTEFAPTEEYIPVSESTPVETAAVTETSFDSFAAPEDFTVSEDFAATADFGETAEQPSEVLFNDEAEDFTALYDAASEPELQAGHNFTNSYDVSSETESEIEPKFAAPEESTKMIELTDGFDDYSNQNEAESVSETESAEINSSDSEFFAAEEFLEKYSAENTEPENGLQGDFSAEYLLDEQTATEYSFDEPPTAEYSFNERQPVEHPSFASYNEAENFNCEQTAEAENFSEEQTAENNYEQVSENEVSDETLMLETDENFPAEENFAATAEPVADSEYSCPFCGEASETQMFVCHSCCAVLTLSDLEGLLAAREVDAGKLEEAVRRMEIEDIRRSLESEELVTLGIGYLNLKKLRKGQECLTRAARIEPNDLILQAQTGALAIRLEELERQSDIHSSQPRDRTILVVDDSATIRKLISGKLEKSGHTVVCAVDGMDALAKLGESVPDLVLLDITMPKMDGYQVCKMIRNNNSIKDIPVVMISGKDGFFDKVRGRMAGATGYITKPFGPETLMKTVETYVSPGSGDSGDSGGDYSGDGEMLHDTII